MFDENKEAIRRHIQAWLIEDLGETGDITTIATIPAEHQSKGIIHMKQDGRVAGIPVAQLVYAEVDPTLAFRACKEEGSVVAKGDIIAEVEGCSRSILKGERLALNLLQRLSGIATKTAGFVAALEGRSVRIVDTRKTTPGHRILEKYAVRVGGGYNHRFGLYDAVLIKDNHIKASGGIAQAIRSARERVPHTMKIEIEVEQKDQLEEALRAQADIILLDNMGIAQMREAVKQIKSRSPHVIVEASGGVTLQRVSEIAAAGVDAISVGGLTHSFHALDISLDLFERKVVGP